MILVSMRYHLANRVLSRTKQAKRLVLVAILECHSVPLVPHVHPRLKALSIEGQRQLPLKDCLGRCTPSTEFHSVLFVALKVVSTIDANRQFQQTFLQEAEKLGAYLSKRWHVLKPRT